MLPMHLNRAFGNNLRSPLTRLTLKHPMQRNLWQYLNIIFNRMDTSRLKKYGPDRTCTEWVLRNGGAVKISSFKDYLHDYNLIPPEGSKIILEAVDGTESSIMHYGFDHFIGCTKLQEIILHKCDYVYDQALEELKPLNATLKQLQVSECHNVSDTGLLHLGHLKALNKLVVKNLSGVKDFSGTVQTLQKAIPNCRIN